MSDLFTQIDLSRNRRATGSDSNFIVDERGGRFESPPEMLQEFGISLPEDQYATNPPPRTEPLSEEEMQAFRDAAKAKGIDFDGFIMPNKGTGRSRGNDYITSKVMAAGQKLAESMKAIDPKSRFTGFDEYQVRSIANDIMGNPAAENFSDQIGLVDFLGLGAFYGAEEGLNTAKGGYNQYREYLNRLDSGDAQSDKINLPGTAMNMDLNALSAGSDMVMGGVEAGLNVLTSAPALRQMYVGAKNLGGKILEGARTRKSTRLDGTKLMSGIDGQSIDDAIVAVGDMFTPQVDQDELGFFSKALEEVKNLKQEKGQGSQYRAMLLNAGVKPDELKWTGLDDLLSKKNVTKEELMEHAKNNRVQIKETVLEGPDENTPASLNFDGGEVLDDMELFDGDIENMNDDLMRADSQLLADIFEELEKSPNNIEVGMMPTQIGSEGHIRVNLFNVDQTDPFKPYVLNEDIVEALQDGSTRYTDANGKIVDFQPVIDDIIYDIARERYLNNDPYKEYYDRGTGYRITGNDSTGYNFTAPNGERLGGDIYSLDEAKVQAETHAMDYGFIQYEGDARFLDYTQDGGENYREILLQNDNFSGDPELVAAHFQANKINQKMFELRQRINEIESDPLLQLNNPSFTAENQALYNEKKNLQSQLKELSTKNLENNKKFPRGNLNFFVEKSHFNEENIIAHVRVKDRKDINGNKVLYIEEFQSDWAQAGGGRKIDDMKFNSPEIQADFVKKEALRKELNETNMDFIRLYKKKMKGRGLPKVFDNESGIDSGEISPMAVNRIMRSLVNERSRAYSSAIDPTDPVYAHWRDPELKSFYDDKIIPLLLKNDSIKTMTPVPRGPLVEKTDQWVQLGLKRIIRYATENGYDYVAWSPGKIQVARWNEPGLKQFYDSILPKNSNAVLKKLDKKAKVEVIEIPVDGGQDTLAIPITDTIRSSAPKGQPLFTPIAATAVGGGLAAQSMNQEQQ